MEVGKETEGLLEPRYGMLGVFTAMKNYIDSKVHSTYFAYVGLTDFRYYFKKASDEFDCGAVFEEIWDDDAILPMYDGRILGKVERIDWLVLSGIVYVSVFKKI